MECPATMQRLMSTSGPLKRPASWGKACRAANAVLRPGPINGRFLATSVSSLQTLESKWPFHPLLEVWKGSRFTIPKRSPAELPGTWCFIDVFVGFTPISWVGKIPFEKNGWVFVPRRFEILYESFSQWMFKAVAAGFQDEGFLLEMVISFDYPLVNWQ